MKEELSLSSFGFYKVEKGEDLAAISAKFMVPISIILKENLGVVIEEGVTIFVPKVTGKLHVVKPLDTFESIARSYKTTAEKIREINKCEILYPYLVLLIE